ncbi:PREDICTED: copper homeostasis protein cutC homolog, partial [Ceratosolen solmsi marchali]|uniref:Copper homeostasis protein cutC homolog n=1 Tax=Ceratosolen solmsi marchali TaxID=326594 RepID=A0AAJ6YP70_9HYME
NAFQLEICVDSLESIQNALEGGADRLELCNALSEGGLTPSFGLARLAKRISTIPVFAMIRIRGGDFVYESDELDAMLEDLKLLKTIGIDGFVFGALTNTRQLDIPACKKIIEASDPLPVTFHRAFDDVDDPMQALDKIHELGFSRILTSGQSKSAVEGVDLIAKLIEQANYKIIIMPGAGINESNILSIKVKSSATEFHGSAKKIKKDVDFRIGNSNGLGVTNAETVKLMVKALKGGP